MPRVCNWKWLSELPDTYLAMVLKITPFMVDRDSFRGGGQMVAPSPLGFQ